ncbi:hypothetical protein HPB52_005691 [Rhipicephalus sanguineus]|uniref:Uncharacterized protein n=1 Tax=Rhipicephalus sanguineus TaxID=34632 RepID=A0A9D4SQS2_RHISA|nr:hypothetical protein HPB52_005691 [Rhipicephalus sanguineus]
MRTSVLLLSVVVVLVGSAVAQRVFPQGFRGPLLCTVSVDFTESSLLPEDGLCDIIFYDSFYVKNYPLDWDDPGLDHFFDLGSRMRLTSIGASFSPDTDFYRDERTGVLFRGIDNLRDRGVQHFGMLNVFGDYVKEAIDHLTILGVCSTEYGNYYRYNARVGAEYTFDPEQNHSLVFDSEKGLKEKVCAALFEHPNLVFGLAAYDIDFDQEEEPCPNLFIGRGSFKRVKALRFMSGYTPVLDSPYINDTQERCNAQMYTDVRNPCCPGS